MIGELVAIESVFLFLGAHQLTTPRCGVVPAFWVQFLAAGTTARDLTGSGTDLRGGGRTDSPRRNTNT